MLRQAKYYPFGQTYSEYVSATNDIRFPGQLRDDETGLYYNWHRYYGPSLGRYYQADPIGISGGVNQYLYVEATPLSSIDLTGLWQITLTYYGGIFPGVGLGGTVTFGNTEGKSFVGVTLGAGAGAGFSYDPDGELPKELKPDPCGKESRVLAVGVKAHGTLAGSVGPISYVDGYQWGKVLRYSDGNNVGEPSTTQFGDHVRSITGRIGGKRLTPNGRVGLGIGGGFGITGGFAW